MFLVAPSEHCLLMRVHHCVGDGFRLAKILEALTENENGDPTSFLETTQKKFTRKAGFWSRIGFYLNIIPSFVVLLMKTLSGYESEFAGHTSLEHRKAGCPYGKHVLTELPPLSLQEMKEVKNAFQGTVNDALYLLMAGTYRRYAQSKGDPLIDAAKQTRLTARSLVPIAFPDEKDWTSKDSLGNRFCFVSVALPMHLPDITQRCKFVKTAFTYVKTSAFPSVSLWFVEFAGRYAPRSVTQNTAGDVFRTHTNVFSNVPGPENALTMCGEKIVSVRSFFNNLITQFIFVSYDGKIFGTVVADPNVLEPELFSATLLEEWQELKTHFLSSNVL